MEPGYIICMPNTMDNLGVPSSTQFCTTCGAEVWCSLTMTPGVEAGTLRPVCLDCSPGVVEAHAHEADFQIAPEQRPELARLGILDMTERLTDRLNRARRRRD